MNRIDGPELDMSKCENLANFDEAEEALSIGLDRMYYLRRWVAAKNGLESIEYAWPSAVAERQDLIMQLEKWSVAVNVLLKRPRHQGRFNLQVSHHVAVMTINQKVALMMFSLTLQNPDSEPSYLRLCTRIPAYRMPRHVFAPSR